MKKTTTVKRNSIIMSDVQPPINETEPTALDPSNVEDAILARWEDGENLSEPETKNEPEVETEETSDNTQEEEVEDEVEEDNETDPDETEETEDEDEADDVENEKPILADDAEVEIQVDGEKVKASVKDLKRLYGQEASLTRKSQEVARQRKDAEDHISKSNVVLQKMLEKAQAKFKPYSDVDMLVASKTMATEDFAQLRREAKDAEDEYRFISQEADQYYKGLKDQHQAQLQVSAKECVKVLQESVPNWDNNLYNDIRGYAISQGLEEGQVNKYVDPIVIQLINKARLYDQGKKVATIKRKNPTSTKILRSKKAPIASSNVKANKIREATANLNKVGVDLDDISEVIMSRWQA